MKKITTVMLVSMAAMFLSNDAFAGCGTCDKTIVENAIEKQLARTLRKNSNKSEQNDPNRQKGNPGQRSLQCVVASVYLPHKGKGLLTED